MFTYQRNAGVRMNTFETPDDDYLLGLCEFGEWGELSLGKCMAMADSYVIGSLQQQRWFTLGAVIDLVASGHLEVGDLSGPDGFQAWDGSLAERLLRIQQNWAKDELWPKSIDTWFVTTEKARSHLEEWRRHHSDAPSES
jgi:hypothetical protein